MHPEKLSLDSASARPAPMPGDDPATPSLRDCSARIGRAST
eukprot:CAMPEP_0181211318 /NCGR_PEP_ID=MMETSP1096-20121128/23718_1 /TAXON_ID=156174 ORGANISM="Chrysochromulina ericina, Strain CCMP281" /NCGR_SAMPLE_ID=MMETSP1096 /ASSEMBLY_ACC=CAM_ASM_000453 /LENGTH=40 /DNA_ID= /DNA_START= /DNA_END= /DNA_ORIENTATION=